MSRRASGCRALWGRGLRLASARWRAALAAALLAGVATGISAGTSAGAGPLPEDMILVGRGTAATRLTVLGATDAAVFAPALEAFVAARPDVAVRYEQWRTNDLFALGQAMCRGEMAAVDLIVNSAADQQVKLVNDGCARAHQPAEPPTPGTGWRDELFGVTREPAVIVYNRDLVPASEAPRSRFDLIDLLRPADSRYAGRVATYDIEESGLGYLFAFADSQAATTFGGLIEAFARSGAVATCCSAEIIDGVASGRYLVAYNVLGSYALARAAVDPRIGVVAPEDYTLVLSRPAMIPKEAPHPEAAGMLVDFLLSEAGRAALARNYLYVRQDPEDPVLADLPASEDSVYRPIRLGPALLLGLDDQKRARFLDLWRSTFGEAK